MSHCLLPSALLNQVSLPTKTLSVYVEDMKLIAKPGEPMCQEHFRDLVSFNIIRSHKFVPEVISDNFRPFVIVILLLERKCALKCIKLQKFSLNPSI